MKKIDSKPYNDDTMYEGIENLDKQNLESPLENTEVISEDTLESDDNNMYEGIAELYEQIPESVSQFNDDNMYEGIPELYQTAALPEIIQDIGEQCEGITELNRELSVETIRELHLIGFNLERLLNSVNPPMRRYFEQLIIARYHPDAMAEQQTDPATLAQHMYHAYEDVQDDYEDGWTDDESERIAALEDISRELSEILPQEPTSLLTRVLIDGTVEGFNSILRMTRDIFHLDLDSSGNVIRTIAENADWLDKHLPF